MSGTAHRLDVFLLSSACFQQAVRKDLSGNCVLFLISNCFFFTLSTSRTLITNSTEELRTVHTDNFRKSCNCTIKSTTQKPTTTFPLDGKDNVLPPLLFKCIYKWYNWTK